MAEVEVVASARYHELGLLAWSALGRGVLTGKYRDGHKPHDSRAASSHFSWFIDPYLQPRSAAIVDAVALAAHQIYVHMKEASARASGEAAVEG